MKIQPNKSLDTNQLPDDQRVHVETRKFHGLVVGVTEGNRKQFCEITDGKLQWPTIKNWKIGPVQYTSGSNKEIVRPDSNKLTLFRKPNCPVDTLTATRKHKLFVIPKREDCKALLTEATGGHYSQDGITMTSSFTQQEDGKCKFQLSAKGVELEGGPATLTIKLVGPDHVKVAKMKPESTTTEHGTEKVYNYSMTVSLSKLEHMRKVMAEGLPDPTSPEGSGNVKSDLIRFSFRGSRG